MYGKQKNMILSIICTVLIWLWAYAALSKLSEFTAFGYQLSLQPLPAWSVPVLKRGLPIAEIATALLIYCRRTRLKGLIISAVLMLSFTLYVLFALNGAFGEIPCSCAGLISSLKWQGHLVFNIVFTLISLAGLYFVKHKRVDFL